MRIIYSEPQPATHVPAVVSDEISNSDWEFYLENGYVILPNKLPSSTMDSMREELDDIMLTGKNSEKLIMQLDSKTGAYADAGEQSLGWKGSTSDYRKIDGLENHSLFARFYSSRIFNEIRYRAQIETPYAFMRMMMMNKPAMGGTMLPAHQDRWDHTEYDPTLSLYLALDAATTENGCMTMYAGSHKQGIIDTKGNRGILSDEQLASCRSQYRPVSITLEPGEMVVFSCLCVHESSLNKTEFARKSISCLI